MQTLYFTYSWGSPP